MSAAPPAFVLDAFRDLERRQFGIGIDDLLALRSALRAGYGLSSHGELVELCVTLWAKSPGEAATVRSVFARHPVEQWDLTVPDALIDPGTAAPVTGAATTVKSDGSPIVSTPVSTLNAATGGGLRPLPPLGTTQRTVVFAPQYPLTRRTIAQATRRLRRPVSSGPPIQLDVDATIARRSRTGVATPPVLVPRRRNAARLLLLVDRQGSMAPFHPYVDHIRDAIVEDAALARVWVAYFHDSPVARANPRLVRRLRGLFPELDSVLGDVAPSLEGNVHRDPDLVDPIPLDALIDETTDDTGIIVLSDAGAVRGGYDVSRNLTSVAFARAVRMRRNRVVWLNPVPAMHWRGTSAGQLARHVPMLPLDREGLHRAVEVLRGRPIPLERAA